MAKQHGVRPSRRVTRRRHGVSHAWTATWPRNLKPTKHSRPPTGESMLCRRRGWHLHPRWCCTTATRASLPLNPTWCSYLAAQVQAKELCVSWQHTNLDGLIFPLETFLEQKERMGAHRQLLLSSISQQAN